MYCAFLRYFYVCLLDELQFSHTKDENLISMAVLVCRGECSAMLMCLCVEEVLGHVCTCTGQRLMPGISLYHTPP